MSDAGVHNEHEDHAWDINIPDHPPRTDSPEYVASRARLHTLVGAGTFYGPPPIQDHHGGGLWLLDAQGWFFVKNLAGIEWSAQFCAEPSRVDQLRQNAARLYARYPEAVDQLGIAELLATPITDAAGVANWTDSICNASVPMPAALHTGVLPHGGGVHHYPTPITDIETFKRDDFNLFVTDSEGREAAVVPVGPPGSGDGRVMVVWAHPVHREYKNLMRAQAQGQALVLGADHELAKLAFAGQQ